MGREVVWCKDTYTGMIDKQVTVEDSINLDERSVNTRLLWWLESNGSLDCFRGCVFGLELLTERQRIKLLKIEIDDKEVWNCETGEKNDRR